MYVIYKATNTLNGKSYIGFTQNFAPRKARHIYEARHNRDNNKFHNALRKHGPDSFEWCILYMSWDRDHCLNEMEKTLIIEFDTIERGYNVASGGQTGPTLVGETNGMYGVSRKGALAPGYGKVCSESTKRSISEANRGHVVCRDKEGNTTRVPTTDQRLVTGELVPYHTGRSLPDTTKAKMSATKRHAGTVPPSPKGKLWWNNGIYQKRCANVPGDGWMRGRL